MQWLIKYRWITLLLAFALLPFFWTGLQNALKVDNRLSIWFLEDDPQLQEYYDFQDKFGNDELLFILIKSPASALETEFLTELAQLSDSLEKMDRIERVLSPTNLRIPDGQAFGITRFTNLQNKKLSQENRKAIIQDNETLRSILFDSAYSAATLIIQPKKYANYENERADIINRIKALSLTFFDEIALHFAGIGIIYDALNQLSEEEFALYLGMAYIAIFLMIGLIYRQISVILYVLLVIILANCVTLGIYGQAGLQLNLMSSLIPIIISLLGVLDIVHIVNKHQRKVAHCNKSGLAAMKASFIPCFFTSITTMAGFLTLYSSPMPILNDFGIYSAVGIFFCLFFSFLLGPIFLPHIKTKKTVLSFGKIIPTAQFFNLSKQRSILIITAVVITTSIAGLFQIKINSNTLGYFPDDHKVMRDNDMIEDLYGAYLPIEFLLTSTNQNEQETLKKTIKWVHDVEEEVSGFDKTIGYHTLFKSTFKLEYGDKWTQALQSKGLVDQANLKIKRFYPELHNSFIHEESNTYRVTFFTKMLSSDELSTKLEQVKDLANENFGEEEQVSPAGYQPMYAKIISFVIRTQVYSLLLAFIFVLLLLWIITKNLRMALLATFINLLPVGAILGVMGWFNINLDTATASLAAIILCICIDDTIHFIHHFLQHKKQSKSSQSALTMTLQSVGTAILISSTILFLGFGLMVFASLKTVFYFGLLISIAVLTAYLSQIYLFPILLLKLLKKG